jgi:hypothetical protein
MSTSSSPPEKQSPANQSPENQPIKPEPWRVEQQPAAPHPDADVPTTDYVDGVPSFDFVRDRIEGRYATALGTTELSEESAAGRSWAEQEKDHDAAARERLEQIRRSLGGG